MPNDVKKSIPSSESLYLLHPYNSCLVTSIGANGKPNVMAAAWIIPVSVSPPMIAMSIRPERHSHKLILETGEFVVNIPTFEMVNEVFVCGRTSGRDIDKFQEAKLFLKKAEKLKPPIIDDCVAHLECKVVKTMEVGDHTLVVGEIVAAYAVEGCFDLVYDVQKFKPCLHVGKNYFTTWIGKCKEPKMRKCEDLKVL